MPIPGGGTAVSSVGMSGALTAVGIPTEVAVAAVLANQLVANFIPAVPGWFATKRPPERRLPLTPTVTAPRSQPRTRPHRCRNGEWIRAPGRRTDGELVARAQRGDLDAFGDLVRRHEAMAVRVAAVVCGSAGAEDAAQEAFVRAYRSLHRFDAERPFRPWLARIVANVAKNRVRSEQRHVQLGTP